MTEQPADQALDINTVAMPIALNMIEITNIIVALRKFPMEQVEDLTFKLRQQATAGMEMLKMQLQPADAPTPETPAAPAAKKVARKGKTK